MKYWASRTLGLRCFILQTLWERSQHSPHSSWSKGNRVSRKNVTHTEQKEPGTVQALTQEEIILCSQIKKGNCQRLVGNRSESRKATAIFHPRSLVVLRHIGFEMHSVLRRQLEKIKSLCYLLSTLLYTRPSSIPLFYVDFLDRVPCSPVWYWVMTLNFWFFCLRDDRQRPPMPALFLFSALFFFLMLWIQSRFLCMLWKRVTNWDASRHCARSVNVTQQEPVSKTQ